MASFKSSCRQLEKRRSKDQISCALRDDDDEESLQRLRGQTKRRKNFEVSFKMEEKFKEKKKEKQKAIKTSQDSFYCWWTLKHDLVCVGAQACVSESSLEWSSFSIVLIRSFDEYLTKNSTFCLFYHGFSFVASFLEATLGDVKPNVTFTAFMISWVSHFEH